jgi:hypothetical protein
MFSWRSTLHRYTFSFPNDSLVCQDCLLGMRANQLHTGMNEICSPDSYSWNAFLLTWSCGQQEQAFLIAPENERDSLRPTSAGPMPACMVVESVVSPMAAHCGVLVCGHTSAESSSKRTLSA